MRVLLGTLLFIFNIIIMLSMPNFERYYDFVNEKRSIDLFCSNAST